ncbi:hypothetical protein H072_11208 [Dactylellina haptotyla CBS 200.50]|uniref:Uncharacterized protein n=1 Tax=Dactylellina haptotyla (strain CBS 200.50) TaxID=1284197 RepID=S8B8Q4_DACHA|nr:hypothetical protein H072_11208 [Dactylellina haptotyla CBS 200.50]
MLSSVIDGMSTVFTELIDASLHSELLRNDPNFLKVLHSSMSRFVTLAETAEISKLEDSTNASEHQEPKLEVDSPSSKDSPIKVSTKLGLLAYTNPTKNPQGGSAIVEQAVMKTAPFPRNPYGNGWLNYVPAKLANTTSISARHFNHEKHRISVKLLQITLSTAYYALYGQNESGDPSPLGKAMFRHALMYQKKEELLFDLRWFLGPGYPEIFRLGSINLGDPRDEESPLDTISRELLKPVSMRHSAFDEKGPSFLDAMGVEEYLRRRGAKLLDSHTIEIPPAGFKKVFIEAAHPTSRLDDNNFQDILIQHVRTNGENSNQAMPPPNLINFFDHGVFPREKEEPESKFIPVDICLNLEDSLMTTSAQLSQQPHVVNLSKLLQNLTLVSRCFSGGPAYQGNAIEQAILASAA